MSAGQAQPNAGLPPGVSFEDAEKIAQGDMGAGGAIVARFKANHILPHQPAFIAFFVALPDDAWLALRQAMIGAKVPIRDIDKKVRAKRDEDTRPRFDPSAIDADNSYPPFTMTSHGLFVATKQGQDRVCVAFEVLGLMRRALDPGEPKAGSTGWGLLIRFRDSDGYEVSEFVEYAELHRKPSEVCAMLAHVGMSITPGRSEQQAFAEYLTRHPSKKRAQRLAQRGWARVGKQLVYATRKTIFAAEEPEERILLASKVDAVFRPRGTLEGWQNGLARLAEPHRLARLAISTALAGSLLYLGGFESGGIHFGGDSGTGKTTITMFALSVDGDPMNPGPCVMAWDGTFVGFEIGLFDRNDACAVIDEAGKASDFQIGDKIYLLAGGKGRERGNKDITLRETLLWRVSIVSTGEFSLENKIAEIEAVGRKRGRGGQVSRILDIEARGVETTDRGVEIWRKDPFDGENIDSAALVHSIKEQARANYGVARPAFVQALLDNKVDYAFLRKRVAEFVARYKPERAHTQVQRAAERFGVISVAGELAIEYGVLPWEAGASESAAAWAFKQWFERRGPGSFEERQAISAVRSIIERYGVSRFDPLVTPEGAEPSIDLDRHAPVRYGYRRPGMWYVFPEVFRNEFCSGLDHKRVAETLFEHGMLERGERITKQQRIKTPGGGTKPQWFYWITDRDRLIIGDVASLAAAALPGDADLGWASPPCQDVSLAGDRAGLGGKRSSSFWPFMRLMQGLRAEGRVPRMIVIENVCGLLTSHDGKDFDAICDALGTCGYRFGVVVIDAALFVPQSRERVFIIAVDADAHIPAELVADGPTTPFHPSALVAACRRQCDPIWWRLPVPPMRNSTFADIVEDEPQGVRWNTQAQTDELLRMMTPVHLAKIETTKRAGSRMVGGLYRRMRPDADGKKVQRAEVRFDDIAGCLRIPTGGSSRQTIVIVDCDVVKSRLLSPREAARLMGLPEDYQLPSNYNDAYGLMGDGVVVPVVRHLAEHIIEPVLQARTQADPTMRAIA